MGFSGYHGTYGILWHAVSPTHQLQFAHRGEFWRPLDIRKNDAKDFSLAAQPPTVRQKMKQQATHARFSQPQSSFTEPVRSSPADPPRSPDQSSGGASERASPSGAGTLDCSVFLGEAAWWQNGSKG